MTKMIQVREVPDHLHAELVRRARQEGMPLTHYIQGILEREISRPPASEVFSRIESRSPVNLGADAAEILRAERSRRVES